MLVNDLVEIELDLRYASMKMYSVTFGDNASKTDEEQAMLSDPDAALMADIMESIESFLDEIESLISKKREAALHLENLFMDTVDNHKF